jgi:hypothetical protein
VVEQKLVTLSATLDFGRPVLLLKDTVTAIDQQLVADAALIGRRAGELRDAFAREAAALQQLETRRAAILARGPVFPEFAQLLADLDLAPVLACQPAARAIADWQAQPLGAAIAAVNDILRPKVGTLRQMSEGSFQAAALVIFRKQISEPIYKLLDQIVIDLKPFKAALKKIQTILTTLTDLPPKIDAAVAKVLDTTRDNLKQVITSTIGVLQTFQQSLIDTLNAIYARIQKIVGDLSPAWMLNSFAASDFTGGTAGADATPPGMLAMARRIASGSDTNGLRIAALLQTKLSADQLTLLRSEASDTSTSLREGNRANVLLALNTALRDRSLCAREAVDALKANLDTQIKELQSKPQPTVQDIKKGYRCAALRRQLSDAWVAYNSGEDKDNAMIRLNRIVLEAAYPDDISMSLQSLHPFIVENIAHLYPEQTVQRLDAIYLGVVTKVKQLPDQLIRAPLDDEFNKIKLVLKQNFDISGIFAVLEIKMDGLDEDLSQGLDRLSLAYNRLLETFDQRLAAA